MRFHFLVVLLVLFALVAVEAKRGGRKGVSRKPHHHKKIAEKAVEGERAKRSAEEEDEDEKSDEVVVEEESKESKEETSEELYVDDSSSESKRNKRSAEYAYNDIDVEEDVVRDKRDVEAAPKEEKNEGKHRHHHKGGVIDPTLLEKLRAKFPNVRNFTSNDRQGNEEFRAKLAEFRAKFTGKFHNRRATTASL